MRETIEGLLAHMAWADHTIVAAVASQAGAFDDDQVRKGLQHTAVVERFFLALFEQRPFDREREGQVPATIDEMKQRFDEAHANAAAYAARLDDAELARTIEFPIPAFKHFRPAVRDALLHVVMHGEHHRPQVAMHLRALGGSPPMTDYIFWVREVRGRVAA